MSNIVSKLKVLVWRLTRGQVIHLKYHRTHKERAAISNVLSSKETIAYIIEHNCSVARFGDGEFQMIEHGLEGGDASSFKVDTFQSFDKELSAKLRDVLFTPHINLMICIPFPMIDSRVYKGYNRIFFEREWLGRSRLFKESVNRHQVLGDSTFTRFYLHRTDIDDYPAYIHLLKKIWDGQHVILVEGEKSRLGVGNDLFDNVANLRRIICPATNAFAVYDHIIACIEQLECHNSLFLLALGHTATVLAADLSGKGYRAIDLGHIDVEYEWFRMGAKEKCPVKDKYVNEVPDGRMVGDAFSNQQYEQEIIAKILV